MKMVVSCSVFALMLLSVGCGDEEAGGAPAKCRTLARHICEALIDCGLADESDLGECMSDVAADAACDDAIGVERSYAMCLDDVASFAQCDEWPSLPGTCREVIQVRK